jgi:hypothetical protein
MAEKTCPLGHTCDKCLWMTKLRGINPQSGQEVDSEGCAIAFLPILLIENSQKQHQTAAAVESTRNEVLKTISRAAGAISMAVEGVGPAMIQRANSIPGEALHEPN